MPVENFALVDVVLDRHPVLSAPLWQADPTHQGRVTQERSKIPDLTFGLNDAAELACLAVPARMDETPMQSYLRSPWPRSSATGATTSLGYAETWTDSPS